MSNKSPNIVDKFLKSLGKLVQMGWCRVSFGNENNSLMFITFHVHPDDGDKTENIIRPILSDFWMLDRFGTNRFCLSSYVYAGISNENINFIEKKYPNLGSQTLKELEKVTDLLSEYESMNK